MAALTMSIVPLALIVKLSAFELLAIIKLVSAPLRVKVAIISPSVPLAVKSQFVTARTGRVAKNKAKAVITRIFFIEFN